MVCFVFWTTLRARLQQTLSPSASSASSTAALRATASSTLAPPFTATAALGGAGAGDVKQTDDTAAEWYHDLTKPVYAHFKQREQTRAERTQRTEQRREELRQMLAKTNK